MCAIRGVFIHRLFGSAIAIWVMVLGMIATGQAQTAQLEAHVTATSGNAVLISGASGLSSPIRRGDRLTPGDEVETRGGARVILTLTDGSQVIIHPNSRIVIRDFRAAPSARELIDVLVGYVRVKIYHTGKRPNPYRVNTPVASIAVRGTSFGVNVTITGETRVEVFEGLVEVTSQVNPQQKRLLSPGRSVVVRPSGDIGLLAPGAGSELNAVTNQAFVLPNYQVAQGAQSYVDNITSSAGNVSFERFLAYTDSHFDSQENPAYAAQFSKPDGRIYLLPSFSASQRSNTFDDNRPNSQQGYSSYSVAEQTSYFQPIEGTRIVLGATLILSRTHLHSNADYALSTGDALRNANGNLNLTTFNGSFIVARRFGSSQRTSLGLQFDQLIGHVDGESSTPVTTPFFGEYTSNYRSIENDQIKRSRVTVGLAHDFAEGKKLGVFYRRGVATNQRNSTSYDSLTGFESLSRVTAPSSEIGMRWRSPLTSRLYYGLHGSILFDQTKANENLTQETTERFSTQHISRRTVIGAGLGYQIRRHTTIAFDIAGGSFQRTSKYQGNFSPYRLLSSRTKDRFLTLHTGGQTDLGRRFFVNGSLYWQRTRRLYEFFPLPPDVVFFADSFNYSLTKTILNLGPGWHIRRNLSAQYIFSWSSRSEIKSHSVMLRYNFGAGEN